MSDPAMRERVVRQVREQERAEREVVVEKALRLGLSLRVVHEDGRVMELVGFEGDEPLYVTTMNQNAAISGGVVPLRTSPYELSGEGVRVGVWDEGSVRSSHQEFVGERVELRNPSSDLSNHATHVAGTIGASGVDGPSMGMTPQVGIDSYNWNNDRSEMLAAGAATATEGGVIPISNHSYGQIVGFRYIRSGTWAWFGNGNTASGVAHAFGQYSNLSRDWDGIVQSLPYLTIFKAAGNDRPDNPSLGDSIQSPSGAFLFTYDPDAHPAGDGGYRGGYENIAHRAIGKNVITVGAVNDAVAGGARSPSQGTMSGFSSWGPTDDGRIKPDLVANGVGVRSPVAVGNSAYASYSGTSMATPAASGAAALLTELHQREFDGRRIRADMMRALLIHTADDLGTPGPDYRNGWGLINAEAAAEVIIEHRDSPASPRMIQDRLTNQETEFSHTFTWDGVSPIRATLSWIDPPGAIRSGHDDRRPSLVHDLDLTITGPSGSIHEPFVMPFVGTWTQESMSLPATTGRNAVDNVEQVWIPAPDQPGEYVAVVTFSGSLTRAQNFALVVTGGTLVEQQQRIVEIEGNLDFGPVEVGSSRTRMMVLRNPGSQTVSTTGLQLPSGFSSDFMPGTLAGGEEQVVEVYFAPAEAGTYTGNVVLESDAGAGTTSLPVSGTGTSPVLIAELENDVAVAELSGAQGSERFFRIDVPSGQSELVFEISGDGDADLYVRYGDIPTVGQWDHRPFEPGSDERVEIANPEAGVWYVMIRGYTAYGDVTLVASHAPPVEDSRIVRLEGDLNFGNLPAEASATRTLTIHNDGNAALTVTGIQAPDGFSASWSGTIAPGGMRVVNVIFAPDVERAYTGTLEVLSDKTAGTATIGVFGVGVIEQIALSNGVTAGPFSGFGDSSIRFFIDVPAGQDDLRISTSGGEGDLEIFVRRASQATPEDFDESATGPGTGKTVLIENPEAGRWFVLLRATTDIGGVSLLAEYGVEPLREIRLTGNLVFGSVRVNESASREMRIHNDGDAPLVVTGISYPPGFSGPWSGTILPGASRPVMVTFSPAAAGGFGGIVTVASNANAGNATLAASGTGIADTTPLALANGVPVTGLAGASGSQRFFRIDVPEGADHLRFQISGGTGDADLYVRRGAQPTLSLWDHRPYRAGNNETVEIQSPQPGEWHVMLHGFAGYSGVTLTATYQTTQLAVFPSVWFAPAGGGITGIFLTANTTWSAVSNAPWLRATPSSGTGGGIINLIADPNPSTVSSRGATLTVTSGATVRTVMVTQAAAVPPFLAVTPETWTAPGIGGATSVDLSSNVSWNASSSQSWLTVTPTAGSGNTTMGLQAAANETDTIRTATVSLSGGGMNRNIIVTQNTAAARPSFADWIHRPEVPAHRRGPADSAAGDGVANLVKYFHGIDPLETGGRVGLRDLDRPAENQLRARFLRSRLNDGSAEATIRWSHDLSQWHDDGDSDGGTTVLLDMGQPLPDPDDESLEWMEVTAAAYGQIPASLFLRLEVEQGEAPTPPGVPTALAPENVTSTGFDARWEAVDGAAGYLVDVASDSQFNNHLPGYVAADAGDATSLAITGLDSNSVYHFRVRAYNTEGLGEWSSARESTTRLTTPSTPGGVVVTAPAPAVFSVNVAGNAPVTYQWQKRTSFFSFFWENVPGGNGPQLTVSPTDVSMDGTRYRCLITNAAGTVATLDTVLTVLGGSTNELNVSQTSWTAPSSGGSTSIGITANVAWTASSNQGWLTVTPTSGGGNGAITLNAAPNLLFFQRTATVTVTGGGITRTISITQPQPGSTNELNVSSTSWAAPPAGGGTSIGVSANVGWSASSNQGWLTVSPTSGSGNGAINLNATPNGGSSQRTATVTVTGGGVTRTINVTQSGSGTTNQLNVSQSSWSAPTSGGGISIGVFANVPWTAQSSQGWLMVSPPSATGNGSIFLSATPNGGFTQRNATITVTGGGITRTIQVIQP